MLVHSKIPLLPHTPFYLGINNDKKLSTHKLVKVQEQDNFTLKEGFGKLFYLVVCVSFRSLFKIFSTKEEHLRSSLLTGDE